MGRSKRFEEKSWAGRRELLSFSCQMHFCEKRNINAEKADLVINHYHAIKETDYICNIVFVTFKAAFKFSGI